MHRKKWLGLVLPLLIAAAILGMPGSDKRHHLEDESLIVNEDGSWDPSMVQVTATSLADTLSPDFIKNAGISDVAGTKIIIQPYSYSSYFTYQADKAKLIRALNQLPFHLTDHVTDVSARELSEYELQFMMKSVHKDEILNSQAFWANTKDTEVYEVLRPPFRHIVTFSDSDGEVHHRVEYAG